MNKLKKNIAVIGGGAAGFFAAISAASHQENVDVYIFEATNKLLSKVLISGGGRCNVTNSTFEVSELIKGYPRGARELRGPFTKFGSQETVNWFKDQGIELVAESDGRMFPNTNDSSTIANCLIDKAKDLKINILTKHKITAVSYQDQQYELFLSRDKTTFEQKFDQLIITTGGSKSSFELPKSLGHTITELIPSLFSFEIDDERLRELSGLSFKNISLQLQFANKKYQQTGPVLITHWGMSGPAIIKLSALAAKELYHADYQAELKINFAGNFTGSMNLDQILSDLKQAQASHNKSQVEKFSLYDIPKRYWQKIIDQISNKDKPRWSELSKKELNLLAEQIHQAKFRITGKGAFKEEFVTCGGVSLKEVDFKTMESKICPGLYFAGEVLDIDGITGGYNFQSAWTTGWIAGKN